MNTQKAKVAVLKTTPETVLDDYAKLLRLAEYRNLISSADSVADLENIEILGAPLSAVNFHFTTKKSLVIAGDQMLRIGPLRFLEKPLLHSPLVVWAPFASNLYHDLFWYPTIGRSRIRRFLKTDWGRLFQTY